MPAFETSRDYYLRRAREERVTAITCEHNAVAKAHLDMAAEYEKRAGQVGIKDVLEFDLPIPG